MFYNILKRMFLTSYERWTQIRIKVRFAIYSYNFL